MQKENNETQIVLYLTSIDFLVESLDKLEVKKLNIELSGLGM